MSEYYMCTMSRSTARILQMPHLWFELRFTGNDVLILCETMPMEEKKDMVWCVMCDLERGRNVHHTRWLIPCTFQTWFLASIPLIANLPVKYTRYIPPAYFNEHAISRTLSWMIVKYAKSFIIAQNALKLDIWLSFWSSKIWYYRIPLGWHRTLWLLSMCDLSWFHLMAQGIAWSCVFHCSNLLRTQCQVLH